MLNPHDHQAHSVSGRQFAFPQYLGPTAHQKCQARHEPYPPVLRAEITSMGELCGLVSGAGFLYNEQLYCASWPLPRMYASELTSYELFLANLPGYASPQLLQGLLNMLLPHPCVALVCCWDPVRSRTTYENLCGKVYVVVYTNCIDAVLALSQRLIFDAAGVWCVPPNQTELLRLLSTEVWHMEMNLRHAFTRGAPTTPLAIELRDRRPVSQGDRSRDRSLNVAAAGRRFSQLLRKDIYVVL